MIERTSWQRRLAAAGTTLLLAGLGACAESDGSDATDPPSFNDGTSSDTPTSEDSYDAAPPVATKDPTEEDGFEALPACDELAQSIVAGVDVADSEEVEGRSCRFTIGDDPPLGRQVVWITRGGGGWPIEFEADVLNDKLAEGFDNGEETYASSVIKVRAPGWSYGVEFDERVGEGERTSYRLFSFAENGDLLSCHTSVADAGLRAFVEWCDTALAAVRP